ncbi:hypothetical protein ACFRQM_48755 [Streptomyces sp. NPDC056831]|uniref:hypothetical protein n=1 Tax=Streptomyces sp. NPDC056831 TaxID=3345954 RepID=UPI0036ABEF27
MGGPLALATVAYGVTGAMLLLNRRKNRGAAVDRSTERTAALVDAGALGPDCFGPQPSAGTEQETGSPADMKRLAKDQK